MALSWNYRALLIFFLIRSSNFCNSKLIQLVRFSQHILFFTCRKLRIQFQTMGFWHTIYIRLYMTGVKRHSIRSFVGFTRNKCRACDDISNNNSKRKKRQFLRIGRIKPKRTKNQIKSKWKCFTNYKPCPMSWCLGMYPAYFCNGKWLQHTYISFILCVAENILPMHTI